MYTFVLGKKVNKDFGPLTIRSGIEAQNLHQSLIMVIYNQHYCKYEFTSFPITSQLASKVFKEVIMKVN